MKHKSKVSVIAHISMVNESGVSSSQLAAALFDAEIEWLPLEPGYKIVGIVPVGFREITLEDEVSGESIRFMPVSRV